MIGHRQSIIVEDRRTEMHITVLNSGIGSSCVGETQTCVLSQKKTQFISLRIIYTRGFMVLHTFRDVPTQR